MAVDYRLLLDAIIILLLVLTIGYAAILNRRLGRLRGGRAELEAASRGFNEAALRLDSNLKGLKAAAEGAGGILQKRIDRASALCQQLGDLADRAQASAQTAEAPVPRTPKAVQKINLARPKVNRSRPLVTAVGDDADLDMAPLVLEDVADEVPRAKRVAYQRSSAPRANGQATNGQATSESSDLADLLAALEGLK